MWRSEPASRDHPSHPSSPQSWYFGKKTQGWRVKEDQEAGPRQSVTWFPDSPGTHAWGLGWGLRTGQKFGLEDLRGPSHSAFRGSMMDVGNYFRS